MKLARSYSQSILPHVGNYKNNSTIKQLQCSILSRATGIARFSTSEPQKSADKAAPGAASNKSEVSRFDPDEYDDYDEPKTAGQKVISLY